ncbi:MAG: flippase-like domain-containing protein [Patescibacteria group bacterium]|nr:flippase-like domain-containing protein [Patescibacteria group bacterium]
MKRFLKFILSLAIGLIVFLVILYKTGFDDLQRAWGLFFNWQGLMLAVLVFLSAFVGIWKWKAIIKATGYDCSWSDLTHLWLSSFAVGYLTPLTVVGGEMLRIYAANKKCPHLPLEKNIASVFADRILNATVLFFLLFIGFVVFAWRGYGFASLLNISFLAVFGLILFALFLFYFKKLKKESVVEWVLRFFGVKKDRLLGAKNGQIALGAEAEIFSFFSGRSMVFWRTVGLTVLYYAIWWLMAFILFVALIGRFDFLGSFVVFAFVNLAGLTPLPANLGALELGGGLAFSNLGFGFANGVVFAIVFRAAYLLLCLASVYSFVKISVKLADLKIGGIFSKNSKKF